MDMLETFIGSGGKTNIPMPKVDMRKQVLTDELAKETALAQNDPQNAQGGGDHGRNVRSIQSELGNKASVPYTPMPGIESAPSAAKPPADPIEAFISSGGSSVAPAAKATQPSVQMDFSRKPTALDETALNFVSGLGSTIVGGVHGLVTAAGTGSLEEGAHAVRQYQEEHTYQPKSEGGKAGVEMMQSDKNPMNWIPNAADWAGGKVTDITGSPALGTAVNVAGNIVAPVALGKGYTAASSAMKAAPAVEVAASPTVKPKVNYAEWQAQRAAGTAPARAAPATEAVAPAVDITTPAATPGAKLPKDVQAQRAAVLKRVGAPNDVRESAVTGEMSVARTEHDISKLVDDPRADVMRQRLATERQTLQNHAEGIVQDTGGTLGMDESARMARGNTILAPVDALREWFDTETNKQYAIAKERAKDSPVELGGVKDLFENNGSKFDVNSESLQLRKGVETRMRELGIADKEGNILPSTVAQAEKLRQYLNDAWQPRSNKAISALKNALDDDVTSVAGQDIFKDARALRTARGVTLDNPKGIAKLLNEEGVNRSVYAKNIPDFVAGLPVEQLDHIMKTLDTVPAPLKPMAEAARAEIKAQIVNKAISEGSKNATQWNAKAVGKVLTENSEKIKRYFTPEEQAKLQDLRDAGNILHIDVSYPGAAVQAHNLVKRGVVAGLPAAGAVVGGTLGGLVGAPMTGAAVGSSLGARASASMANSASLKQAQRATVKLSDFPVGGRR